MNVLHLINNLNREGAQVMVGNLVTAKSDTDVQYIVCVRQPDGSLVASLREQGVTVLEPPRYYGLRSILQSLNFIRTVCIDNQVGLIHAHMADAAFLGWLAARKLGLPLVITHHGQDILLKCNKICRSVYYVLLNFSAHYASMNVAVSASVAERVEKLLYVKKQNVCVIENGVRVPDKSLLEKLPVTSPKNIHSLTLVTVGRLVSLKGHRQLIFAMVNLVGHFPEIKLYIVGGGKLEFELKKLAVDEGVDEHIMFTGAVDDVSIFLQKADIYISTSESEGMPVSVLEAMAWHVPVVASDIPGNKSVISHEQTGVLYELNNIDDLVNKVLLVASNVEFAMGVAKNSRAMVEQQYSAEVCEHKHELLYKRILA